MLGSMSGDEPGEDMNRAEPCVARCDAVVALGLQRREELGDALGGEVGDVQPFDGAPGVARGELEEQHQGVAVTADRVGTQAPLCRKIVLEELDEIAAECGLGRAAHGAPPSTRSPKARANRSPARATTAGMKRR